MSRPDVAEIRTWKGLAVRDASGVDIGRCTRAYSDDETGKAEWIAVEPHAGGESRLVPTRDAQREGDAVRVAWTEVVILASPALGSPDRVTVEAEEQLYGHYGAPTPAEDTGGPLPATSAAGLQDAGGTAGGMAGGMAGGTGGEAAGRPRLVSLAASAPEPSVEEDGVADLATPLGADEADDAREIAEMPVSAPMGEEAPAGVPYASQTDTLAAPQAETTPGGGPEAGRAPETAGARPRQAGRKALVPAAAAAVGSVIGAGAWVRARRKREARARQAARGLGTLVPAAGAAAAAVLTVVQRRRKQSAGSQPADRNTADLAPMAPQEVVLEDVLVEDLVVEDVVVVPPPDGDGDLR